MATVRIQVRRGTASQWTSANPILAAGELGVESDTNLFKFGNGSTTWTALAYANNSDVAIGEISQDAINTALTMGAGLTKTYNDGANTITITVDSSVVALKTYVDSAVSTHEADTTSVHGIADTAALATKVYADSAVSTHEADTTSVHGIADTAALATKVYADSAVSTHESDTTSVHGIADTAALATKVYADSAVSTHEADTTSVHGIADTSILVTTTGSQTLTSKSLTSPALTGTPTAPTASAGTDTTQVATTAFVQDAIELVVGAAPAALNTLAEIATSLANNADLSGTLTSSISGKVAKAGDTMSGELNMGTNKIANLGVPTTGTDASTKAYTDGAIVNSLSNHSSISENIHGILNAANLVYTADTRLSDLRVPQDLSVSTGKIVDLNVTTAKLNDSAVTSAKIADGAVATSELGDLAVTTAKIADSAVTAVKIADSAVTAAKIGIGAVETAALADLAVTTAKIADSAVTSGKIASNAISQSHLSDDSVGTNEIGGLAVTTAKIADSAVTTVKINDAAITSDKLGALSVIEGKIADGAVTSGKIANGTIVDADVSASAAIATSKISGLDTALGLRAPLASPTFTGTVTLPAGTITSGMILDGTIVDADVSATAAIAQSKISGLTTDLSNKLASATAASTYAPLASPALTGVPTAPTAAANTNSTQVATTAFVGTAVADLVASAPAALNTLNELATALGNDASFSTTITNALAAKAPLASPTFTGTNTVANITVTGTSNMSANGVQFSDGTQTKQGVPSLTTIASATTGAYNLSTGGLALRDQLIPIGGTHVITIPTNTTTAFPIGTSISFYQSAGTGGSFSPADGTVTLLSTPGSTLRALSSSATLTKVATNTWLLAGDLRA
jgi:hypothetical protein